MKKIYVRWLGWLGQEVTRDTFKFEMSRGTESCAEMIDHRTGYMSYLCDENNGVWIGLLCNPNNVAREFKNDAWSKLSGFKLQRGKNGVRSGNKLSHNQFCHTEAWIKPGGFQGIVLSYQFDSLSKCKQEIVRAAARKYNLPVYYVIPLEGLRRVKGVFK